jgi:tetratricopeptide (TPR) repeat protein
MRKLYLLFVLPLLLAGFIRFSPEKQETPASIELRKINSAGCSPYSGGEIKAGADGKFITVLPGWGNHAYSISTQSDSAQFYFNQGLNMYYGYHWREARASFKEAARFDPGSPMMYWGEALALGPGYNFSLHYKMPKEVPGVLQKMNQNSSRGTAKEKRLIEIMNSRYDADSSDRNRVALNIRYEKGLRKLIDQYPNDPEIKVFYIDAVMLVHPWDFWNNDGTPKAWTPEVVDFCEQVLKENPKHPAALHYYIHITEASRHPEVALPAADMLKVLQPGIAHMVHMSSHEYERNGLYAKGVEVNDKADDDLNLYKSLAPNIDLHNRVSHYYAVQSYCALSGGMYKRGLPDAIRCRESVSPTYEMTYQQYLYMMPEMMQVRLGKWTAILNDHNEPDPSWNYAGVLKDFAIGMAFANTGRPDSARTRLQMLRQKAKDSIMSVADTLTNAPELGAGVAEEILEASIFFAEKKYDEAIAHIRQAIQTEDRMLYSEPKDWLMPARQYLGAFYLKLGRPALAEKVYREDLAWNPGNGWSLLGLCQSLNAQHREKETAACKAKYLESLSHADVIPPASVYMN